MNYKNILFSGEIKLTLFADVTSATGECNKTFEAPTAYMTSGYFDNLQRKSAIPSGTH